ncbi:MAG: glycosyltransferase family 39 protein [Hominilimicola sp.]
MIYSIIVCIIFFSAAAVWLIRFIGEAGFRLPGSRALSFITANKACSPSEEKTTTREYLYIFLGAVIFRIIILLLGWLACGIFSEKNIPNFIDYLEKWNIWDGPHYLEIAANGYSHHIEEGQYLMLVFFPLFPLITRIFHYIIPNYTVAAITVSTLCYAGGCTLMHRLVTIDYSKSTAMKSIIFLSVYPFAFFFGSVMTESVFFLFVIATFLAIRNHKWLLAGILGMFAALSRSVGVLMIIPAAVEWVQHEQPISLIRDKKWKLLGHKFTAVLPVLIMPIGTLIYLFINYKTTGDAFIFKQYQSEHWSMNLQFFGKTLRALWEYVTRPGYDWSTISCMFIPELLALPILAAIILYSTRRTRSLYVIFMLIYYAFNAAASWPLSLSRYLSCMFPIFWIAAEFTDRHKWLELPLTAVMAIGLGIYLTGYLTMHQIM